MRRLATFAVLLVLAGCGSKGVHYDVPAALDCVQRTDSQLLRRLPHGILVAFVAPDGVSSIEPVAVAFKPLTAQGVADSASHGLRIARPVWTDVRGDADVWGGGPYEPPIAKRQHVPDAQASAAAKVLDARARRAVDACLKQNER